MTTDCTTLRCPIRICLITFKMVFVRLEEGNSARELFFSKSRQRPHRDTFRVCSRIEKAAG